MRAFCLRAQHCTQTALKLHCEVHAAGEDLQQGAGGLSAPRLAVFDLWREPGGGRGSVGRSCRKLWSILPLAEMNMFIIFFALLVFKGIYHYGKYL